MFILVNTVFYYLQIVQQQYSASGATSGPHLSVEFETDTISLEVPSEGVTLENGWRIFPLLSPVVRKLIAGKHLNCG